MKNLIVICLVVLLCTSLATAWDDDYDRGDRQGRGHVRTYNKHKSSMNMAHSHERGRETVRRFKRDWDEGEDLQQE